MMISTLAERSKAALERLSWYNGMPGEVKVYRPKVKTLSEKFEDLELVDMVEKNELVFLNFDATGQVEGKSISFQCKDCKQRGTRGRGIKIRCADCQAIWKKKQQLQYRKTQKVKKLAGK